MQQQNEDIAEEQEVEVIEENEEQEVEVKQLAEAEGSDKDSSEDEDELENYSDSVQRRIRKLTGKFREEERQKNSAVEYAESVKKQNDELQNRLNKLDQTYVGEFATRLESQVIAAKDAYKRAHEDGDSDAMFEAQQNISRLALEQAKYDSIKQRGEVAETRTAEQAPVAPSPQVAQQRPPQPDPKAEEWAGKNAWFGEDQTMTYAAFGIHRQLIEDEGFDPATNEYYTELDRRIRTEFPHKFKSSKRDTGPRVASAESTASKSSSKGRRTVRLTPSQIAIAKRLNVPLEEYAKYVKD
jgi:hypothetical protein